ncbi:zf-HC2 domain-containing protein, partial [Peptococcaceae bacterium]|nr:zf-HC2 domain-containing protein [Peptococcaceae bacterium]
MNCQSVCENLSAYIDKELDLATRSQVAAHLLACHYCRTQWEQLQQTSLLLQNLPEVKLPDNFQTDLSAKLAAVPVPVDTGKGRFTKKIRKMVQTPWYKAVAVAAVFSVTIGVASLWGDGGIEDIDIINHPEIAQNVQNNNNQPGPDVIVATVPEQSDSEQSGDSPEVIEGQVTGDNAVPPVVENPPASDASINVPVEPSAGNKVEPSEPALPIVDSGVNVEPEPVANPSGLPEWVSGGSQVFDMPVAPVKLLNTSLSIQIIPVDAGDVAQQVLAIAEQRGVLLADTSDAVHFTVSEQELSKLLAELGSLGEEVSSTTTNQDLMVEYRNIEQQLFEKSQRKSELTEALAAVQPAGRVQLQQELDEVIKDIKALNNQINDLKDRAKNIEIKVSFV